MLETFKNAWKIEDLRKKIIFTAIVLILYRLGCAIAVPFIRPSALKSMISAGDGNMLGYLNMISGGAFANATLFAQPRTKQIINAKRGKAVHCLGGVPLFSEPLFS